jgi:sugar phosphate isomerase/epimerase
MGLGTIGSFDLAGVAARQTKTMINPLSMRMKTIVLTLLAGAITLVFVLAAGAAERSSGSGFLHPVGLQLYSLRDQFAKDVPGTLDKVRDFGFKNVELAGTYGLTPAKFKQELDARGLRAVAGHFPFDRFRTDVEGIARDAKILGLEYVGCAWIDHPDPFNEKTCREAIAVFNQAGAALVKSGLHFYYHTHGYEFQPHGKGTLFDLMLAETNPKLVSYEMDVFWIVHAGQDPVKLFQRFPGRWQLTHLKGMKESTPTGLLTGHSEVTNDLPLGAGKIDYQPIFRAANRAGVKWNFIEDESPSVEQQIPQSLRYLKTVKW